jgi:hypothetical protein
MDLTGDIEDDEFWREFRSVIKGVKLEANIFGKILENTQ